MDEFTSDQPNDRPSTELSQRNPDGTFKPGNNVNPAGRPTALPTWQRHGDTAQMLMNMYTPDEIIAFAESKYERSKLTTPQAIAALHIARALDPELTKISSGSDDVRQERKDLLDRIEGPTNSKLELTGASGTALSPLIKIVFEGNNNAKLSSPEDSQTTIENAAADVNIQGQSSSSNTQLPKIEFEG